MAYSADPADYNEADLLRVAEMYFVQRATHAAIARELGQQPRARVLAMCEAARRAGIVHVAILPSRSAESGRLRNLASQVRERFGLLDCIVVHGRSEMLGHPLGESVREVIVDVIASEAAVQLDRRFGETKDACLAVTYGFVTRKVADYLRPSAGLLRRGLVVAAQGFRRIEVDRFDANNIVRDIARQFGSPYACLPIPAMVDVVDVPVVRRMPLVRPVLEALEAKTSLVLGSIASHHQTDWTPRKDSLQNDLFTDADMAAIADAGGIGNFGGWWFDHLGQPVEYGDRTVVGLGLRRIKDLVRQRHPVILAVGADPTRIPSLVVALSCEEPLGNVWIGDEATARVLLGEHRLRRADIAWRPEEEAVLDRLAQR
ncbi:MAG TPA: sugar-binding domain-containing protein [Chthonomonadales bacterium]|nr:sugar-binding domain-containing protein [Chthonomonadales bacterium]